MMSQSKYRLNDEGESDNSESMITYFKQLKEDEMQKLQAIEKKYGACQEINIAPNYRPLRMKKVPIVDQW